ncbi:E3 ubiquitin-protein ligase RNF217-like [Watersipora subatra]|uniref:E3 ubiquitin-protein ligase RNF217-like n=1 Tax=Watersipora subatra TaxID=2589382 RepID=UPI00355C5602
MAEMSEWELSVPNSLRSSNNSTCGCSVTHLESEHFVEAASQLGRRLKEEHFELFESDFDLVEFGPFMRPLRPFYGEFDEEGADDESVPEANPFLYEQGCVIEDDCQVCMTRVNASSRACCGQMVCDFCMMQYMKQKIEDGLVHMICPASDCSQPVSRDEIICRLIDDVVLEKYHRFVVNANADPNKKTCPSCCIITTLEVETFTKMGHQVVCDQCGFCWCFECHAPKHDGVKCKENIKGLKALVKWSKSQSNGQRNARRCPKCKLLIQRSGGCDHMQCTRCKTHFCYACGGRQMHARFLFGNHYDRLNVLGCPKNFMSGKKKHLRRFVRGSLLSGKLIVAIAGSAVLVGLLPIAAVAALFAGPAIGFVRLHRYLREKKEMRQAQRQSQRYNAIILSYKNILRPDKLVPRRDIDESEWDIDEILHRLERVDNLTADHVPVAASSDNSMSESPTESSMSISSKHSFSLDNQSMLIADKDETTRL